MLVDDISRFGRSINIESGIVPLPNIKACTGMESTANGFKIYESGLYELEAQLSTWPATMLDTGMLSIVVNGVKQVSQSAMFGKIVGADQIPMLFHLTFVMDLMEGWTVDLLFETERSADILVEDETLYSFLKLELIECRQIPVE